ncbi:MAG: HNH endonuclease [Clostridia bacterium]|nr:HNH endonuclease [Clostridia bacterium]
MPFSEKIKEDAMVACGRHCCICHKFCGNKMEVHHIVPQKDGGEDSFENAIPLCFDCHAEVGAYNTSHPKGVKFSKNELKRHRDNWYKCVQERNINNETKQPVKLLREKGFENTPLTRITSGIQLLNALSGSCGAQYNYEEPKTREEAFIISEFQKEMEYLLDADSLIEESERVMLGFDLNDFITQMDEKGFWLFVGKENQMLTGGVIKTPECFPILHIYILKKENIQSKNN